MLWSPDTDGRTVTADHGRVPLISDVSGWLDQDDVEGARPVHALDSLNHWFLINEMLLVGSTYWNIAIGQEIGAVARDDEGVQTMRNLGRNMAAVLTKLRA